MADMITIVIFSWIVSTFVIKTSEGYVPGISNFQWLYNIVFSFRSRCRHNITADSTKISPSMSRYLFIYSISNSSAIFFGLVTHSPEQFFILGILSAVLLVLMVLDWYFYLLPDVLVFFVMWLGLLCPFTINTIPYDERILGVCIGYLSLNLLDQLFFCTTGKHGIGHGDMKFLGALGAWCGWDKLPDLTLIACIMAVLHFYSVKNKYSTRQRQSMLPFGSFLAIGSLIVIPYNL